MQPGGDQAYYAGDNGEVGTFRISRGDRYVSADAHHCLAGLSWAYTLLQALALSLT